jgi:saccharopine dehydrogenase-like NADP-dependent oxidoreductase
MPRRIGGIEITPRRVLIDALERHLPRGGDDVVLLRTFATARREGTTVTRGHQMVDRHDGRFSALARTTAFPASALAHMLVSGSLAAAGATTMERVVPAGPLLAELAPLGVTFETLRAVP